MVFGILLQSRVVFLQTIITDNLDTDPKYIYDLKMKKSLLLDVLLLLGVIFWVLLQLRVAFFRPFLKIIFMSFWNTYMIYKWRKICFRCIPTSRGGFWCAITFKGTFFTFITDNLDIDSKYIYDLKMNKCLFLDVLPLLGVVCGNFLQLNFKTNKWNSKENKKFHISYSHSSVFFIFYRVSNWRNAILKLDKFFLLRFLSLQNETKTVVIC